MNHSSKTCTCGARFPLQVELAVHCHTTGHSPFQTAAAAVAVLPAQRAATMTYQCTRNWKKTLVTVAALGSLLGLSCGLDASVRTYTSWKYTSNVLMLP